MIFEDLIGVPYKLGGRDLAGMDCWGLCIEVGRRAGIDLPPYASPENLDMVPVMTRGIVGAIHESPFQKIHRAEPFCLVAIRTGAAFVDHVGVVMEDRRRFIHASLARGIVTLERLDHPFWAKRIAGFYRVRDSVRARGSRL